MNCRWCAMPMPDWPAGIAKHESRCCNPNHMFLGTQSDNGQDMARKGRWRNQFGSGFAYLRKDRDA